MRILFIILLFLNNQSLDSIFDSSNDLYTNGNYQMAVEGYQSILNSGFESAELYYNIGNAFYKLNNIPESNFFYEKAKSISPSDEDILMNLSLYIFDLSSFCTSGCHFFAKNLYFALTSLILAS